MQVHWPIRLTDQFDVSENCKIWAKNGRTTGFSAYFRPKNIFLEFSWYSGCGGSMYLLMVHLRRGVGIAAKLLEKRCIPPKIVFSVFLGKIAITFSFFGRQCSYSHTTCPYSSSRSCENFSPIAFPLPYLPKFLRRHTFSTLTTIPGP